MKKRNKVYDAAIIGAGPAGIACAIQLKRQGVELLLLEKNEVGGLLRNANLIENFPGYPEGISGIELTEKFRSHLIKVGVNPVHDEAAHIRASEETIKVEGKEGLYQARFVVVASGTIPKKLSMEIGGGVENRVFYEVCELYKHPVAGKKIVIIGSGDAAFDYALNLANSGYAEEVFILNRSKRVKSIGILRERALANGKIRYIEDEEPAEFLLENGVPLLICKNGSTYSCDYVLSAVGRVPCDGFLKGTPEFNTNLLLVGDVKNGNFRQATIAMGDGIRAAMEIVKRISIQD